MQKQPITEQLFEEALALPRQQRAAFLEKACRGAPDLRRILESLLAENDKLSGFLSESPWATPQQAAGALAPGTRLGRYLILEPLGSGGMGVVYRARDEKLEREVAVKLLAPGVLTGEEARRHFRREALALARLNHPCIASVYDVGEHDGAGFIVMELVPGESLAAKLRSGPLQLEQATAIALHVSEALAEAHEHGVIHRDLKPANVMITPKGNAKVLDFGLARMLTAAADSTLSLSETGGLLGTPLYMSPEQAQGRSVDARTDLWSLGVLYFESLAGRPPFRASSALATLHAIASEPAPPLRSIRPDVPPLAVHIVTRALEKDCGLRYQRAADLETDLKRLMRDLHPSPASPMAPLPSRSRGRPAIWLVAPAAAVLLGLAAAWLLRPTTPPPRVTGITQLTHDGTPKLFVGPFPEPAMFTDGPRVYFQVADFSQSLIMQVSSEGGVSEPVSTPFRHAGILGLSAAKSELLLQGPPFGAGMITAALWAMPVPGGQPRRIGNLLASDASWTPDEASIYYSAGAELWRTQADGSQPKKLLTLSGQLYWIRFSPDGRLVRFSAMDMERDRNVLWEASVDGSHLRQVLPGWDACCGAWTPGGKYFVFASRHGGNWNLWAMREAREWWRRANPAPVQLAVGQLISQVPLPSKDGKSIFFVGATPRGELVRYDTRKHAFLTWLPGLSAEGLNFSADGSRMAYVTVPDGALWQSKADGSDRHQLTFSSMEVGGARWSPDGTKIAFWGHDPGKTARIYVVPADGGAPEQITRDDYDDVDPSWSPHGDAIAFGGWKQKNHPIQILNLTSHALTTLPGSSRYYTPRWSPDGRWLVAIDNDSDGLGLFNFANHNWEPLTTLSARSPNWAPDSQCVYFSNYLNAKLPVYRVCLSDRKPQLLVNLAQGGQPGSFRPWTGLAPDGSILGVRDISLDEIYALQTDLP